MANVICLDFDDTIVLENTTRQIHARFAAEGWEEAERRRIVIDRSARPDDDT